jgi:hypothetical protein
MIFKMIFSPRHSMMNEPVTSALNVVLPYNILDFAARAPLKTLKWSKLPMTLVGLTALAILYHKENDQMGR